MPSTSLFWNGLYCNSDILQRDIGGRLISRKGPSRSLVLCPSLPKHRIPKALLIQITTGWSAIQAYGGEGIESEPTALDAPR
jgi:hypothetical protein